LQEPLTGDYVNTLAEGTQELDGAFSFIGDQMSALGDVLDMTVA